MKNKFMAAEHKIKYPKEIKLKAERTIYRIGFRDGMIFQLREQLKNLGVLK